MNFDLDFVCRRTDFTLTARVQTDDRRIGLFGPSGAGKTTLVRALAGLESVTGRIAVDGRVWQDAGARAWAPQDRKVGWVPQAAALLSHLSVAENLRFSPRFAAAQFDEVVEVLGLGAFLARHAGALSGGEQKRVALGRALLAGPELLLLDEPLSGLDWPRRTELLSYLLRALDRYAIPAIYVSHDPFEIGVFCDSVWLLEEGQLIGTGTPEQIFLRPEGASQALLAGVENIWKGRIDAVEGPRVRVAVGGTWLSGEFADGRIGQHVVVVLAAAEVLLAREVPRDTSARNVWLGQVTEVAHRGREVAVHLSCADAQAPSGDVRTSLVSIITPAALADIELKRGDQIHALFKSAALRIFEA